MPTPLRMVLPKPWDWAVRFICLTGLPALVGLIILAQPIIAVLFLRGKFAPEDVYQVSLSLTAYASGLLSFMMIKVLAPGYFSRQDTKTPMKIGVVAMVSNMVLNLMLVPFLGYIGLALATALSATLNAGLLYWGLKKDGVYQFSTYTLKFFAKLIVAVVAMAVLLVWITPPMDQWLAVSLFDKVLWVSFYITCGVACYVAVLAVLGVRPRDLKSS